jgi:hypothetical protein
VICSIPPTGIPCRQKFINSAGQPVDHGVGDGGGSHEVEDAGEAVADRIENLGVNAFRIPAVGVTRSRIGKDGLK